MFEAVATVQPDSIADFEHRVSGRYPIFVLCRKPRPGRCQQAYRQYPQKKAEQEIPAVVDPDLFELYGGKRNCSDLQAIAALTAPLIADANTGPPLNS